MKGEYKGIIIGISIGVAIGAVLATWILLCMRFRRRHAKVQVSGNEQRGLSLPIRFNAADSSTMLSDSTFGHETPEIVKRSGFFHGLQGQKGTCLQQPLEFQDIPSGISRKPRTILRQY